MPTGRPPKPVELHIAQGTFRKDRHGGARSGVSFSRGAPKCPAVLGKVAKAEWRRVVAELEGAGVVQATDLAILAGYCEAWGEFCEALAKIATEGKVVFTAAGKPCPSPWVAIKNAAADGASRYGALLGLSPSSRSKIQGTPPAKQADNSKARFFTGPGKDA